MPESCTSWENSFIVLYFSYLLCKEWFKWGFVYINSMNAAKYLTSQFNKFTMVQDWAPILEKALSLWSVENNNVCWSQKYESIKRNIMLKSGEVASFAD